MRVNSQLNSGKSQLTLLLSCSNLVHFVIEGAGVDHPIDPQFSQNSNKVNALPKPKPMSMLTHLTSPPKYQADWIREFERYPGIHPSHRPPCETHPSVCWKKCQSLTTGAHLPP